MESTEHESYYLKIEALESKLAKERSEISDFIYLNINSKLNDIKESANIQLHVASQRQRLADKIATMRSTIRKQSEKSNQIRKSLFYKYKTEYNVRLVDTEISKHIDADVEPQANFKIVLENQIDFYKRTIDGLDKVGYSVKNLIEVSKYLNGF